MSVSLAEFAGDPELQLRMAARLGAIGAWTVAVGPLRVTVSRESHAASITACRLSVIVNP